MALMKVDLMVCLKVAKKAVMMVEMMDEMMVA